MTEGERGFRKYPNLRDVIYERPLKIKISHFLARIKLVYNFKSSGLTDYNQQQLMLNTVGI